MTRNKTADKTAKQSKQSKVVLAPGATLAPYVFKSCLKVSQISLPQVTLIDLEKRQQQLISVD